MTDNAPDQPLAPTGTSRVRYFVVFVSMLMAVLLYLDRFCVSFAADYIREDLGMTQADIGWMFSIFFWFYALAQVPSGWLSDRYGSRIMLTIYIVSWSLFTLLTGVVNGLLALLLMRVACGLGQAGAYPTSASIVSKWVPLTGRAAASSVVALGGRCGGAIAPLLTALLMVQFVPIAEDGSSEPFSTADILHSGRLAFHLAPYAPKDDEPSQPPEQVHAWHRLSSHLDSAVRGEIIEVAANYRQLANQRKSQQDNGDLLTADPLDTVLSDRAQSSLVSALNQLLDAPGYLDPSAHAELSLPRQAADLASRLRQGNTLAVGERRRLNRLILETSFSDDLRKIYVAGWRPVMYAYGAVGFLVAGLYWMVVRNRPADHPRVTESEWQKISAGRSDVAADNADGAAPIGPLLRNFSMWCDCFTQTFSNIAWVFLVTWLPRYLRDVHNVPIVERGLLASIPLAAGMVGMLTGGKATDILTAKVGLKWGRRWPLFGTKITGAIAYGLCLFFATLPTSSPWNSAYAFTACFCVVSFSVDFGNPANWAFKQDVGGRYVGSVLGWGNMWGNLGAAISPLIYATVLGEAPGLGDWNNMMLVCMLAFVAGGVCALGIDASKPIVEEDHQPTP